MSPPDPSGAGPSPVAGPWPDLAGRLIEDASGRRHVLPIRVYFEDTDFSGLVYHATYLRWCERGRSDFLRLLGNDHQALFGGAEGREPAAFVVRRMALEYLRPARIDEVLEVTTRAKEWTRRHADARPARRPRRPRPLYRRGDGGADLGQRQAAAPHGRPAPGFADAAGVDVGWVKRSADPTPAKFATCVGSSLTLDPTYTRTPTRRFACPPPSRSSTSCNRCSPA